VDKGVGLAECEECDQGISFTEENEGNKEWTSEGIAQRRKDAEKRRDDLDADSGGIIMAAGRPLIFKRNAEMADDGGLRWTPCWGRMGTSMILCFSFLEVRLEP
jgi:hypothetical protein